MDPLCFGIPKNTTDRARRRRFLKKRASFGKTLPLPYCCAPFGSGTVIDHPRGLTTLPFTWMPCCQETVLQESCQNCGCLSPALKFAGALLAGSVVPAQGRPASRVAHGLSQQATTEPRTAAQKPATYFWKRHRLRATPASGFRGSDACVYANQAL